MKVIVLGAKGMLGTELVACLVLSGVETHGLNHYEGNVLDLERLELYRKLVKPDLVINCAGVRNEGSLVNSLGPWNVSRVFSCPVWHISTDCVFDPRRRGNHRHSPDYIPMPVSEYGVSKLLGEITASHVRNIRTSFIGFRHGLLKWFLDLPTGSAVDGWTNALWSGSTVYTVAEFLATSAVSGTSFGRIEHLAMKYPISKCELLEKFKARFGRDDITIVPVDEPHVNRSMESTLLLPTIESALESLHFVQESVRS